ncbi:MAG: MFS transporter [Phototrophicales bacterium]|nr:MFS transporter [Phototrophicales bacterium]
MFKNLDLAEANFRHLVLDIAWFGLALSATSRFASAYAIRVDATATEVNLLVALPGIVMLLSTLFTGWWRRKFINAVPAQFYPGLFFRFIYLLPAFTPLFPVRYQPAWLIFSATAPALAQGVAGAIFMELLRDSVPVERVATLFSRRAMAVNFMLMIGSVFFGVVLEGLPFPLNYQVMFLFAFILSLVSFWHVNMVKMTDDVPRPVEQNTPVISQWTVWKMPNFIWVALVTLFGHISYVIIAGVIPLRLMNELNAGEGYIALFGLVELSMAALSAYFADRLMLRWGAQRVTAYALFVTSLAALVLAVTSRLDVALLSAIFSGAGWVLASTSMYILLIERTPKEYSTATSTGYQQVVGVGIFLGPLLGSVLVAMSLSLVEILYVTVALRILAAVFAYMNLVPNQRPKWSRRRVRRPIAGNVALQ